MAAFPPIPQIVGSHLGVYEGYFLQADPKSTGSIGANDAAMFLKKSGLQDTVLSQIWDQSDPTGKGYLEKPGFFVALKLIALAQNGQEVGLSRLGTDTPPPNLGPVEVPEVLPSSPLATGASNWDIKPSEKSQYDDVFNSLGPVNGLLSGDKVKPVLLNSHLPVETLGRIWDLSDIDKDGYLDGDEFAVTMHLVYRCKQGDTCPLTLPPTLIPPSKRKKLPGAVAVLPGAVPVLPGAVPVLPGVAVSEGGRNTPTMRVDSPSTTWVVSAADKTNSESVFRRIDTDFDGLVTGQEAREVFVKSGLPNPVLAHVWNLCDTKGVGKLNVEEFALAMHLIQQKMKGLELPNQLAPEMVPPSSRPKATADPAAFGVQDGTNVGPYAHVADFSAIKELDMISKEIDEIKREKMQIERDSMQRSADIKIRQSEVQVLQKELDSITGTLQQLENQKKEAQKRLDELDEKKSDLENKVKEMKEKCDTEQKEVDKLHAQLNNQEKSMKDQELELSQLKTELAALRNEESSLESKVDGSRQQLESLVKTRKDLTLQINQTKSRVQHLQDQQRGIQGGNALSINGETSASFASELDQLSTRATVNSSPASSLSSFSTRSGVDDFKEDPFKNKDPFGGGSDPFQEDPFKGSDPFKSETFGSDPFPEDPFKDDTFASFSSSNKDSVESESDPFGGGLSDPFGFSSSNSSHAKKSSDPFGSTSPSKSAGGGGDLFNSDPFAPQSSSRNESPRPALPPKQRKQPPPRPAPPKAKSPLGHSPSKPKVEPFGAFGSDPFSGSDPFASTGSAGNDDAFANFADFSPGKLDWPDSEASINADAPLTIKPVAKPRKNSSGATQLKDWPKEGSETDV